MGEQHDKKMTLVDHLQELRMRLIWVIVVFVLSFIVGFLIVEPVIGYFKNNITALNLNMNVFSLSDGIRIYLQFAFMIGLTITLPFALFQIWRFVAPGLTKRERRATAWFIPTAFLLFIVGVSFAYFIIFPMIVAFLSKVAQQLGVNEMYGMSQYFSFMFNMIIPFGILFELPIVVIFLTRIGVISPKLLVKFRKFAYLILVVIAASITPPDLVSEILVSLPLIFLYEISVWLSRITARKRKKAIENSLDEKED